MTGSEAPAHEQTLLLADHADPAGLTALAAELGWRLDFTEDFRRDGLGQRAWETEDATLVYELVHHDYGTRCVVVRGASADSTAPTAAAVAGAVPTVALETVLDALLTDEDPADLLHGLRLLQTAHDMARRTRAPRGPLDPRHATAIARLLGHPQRQVRLTAMLVADHLRPLAPELPALVVARQGVEEELTDLVDAFAAMAEEEQAGAG